MEAQPTPGIERMTNQAQEERTTRHNKKDVSLQAQIIATYRQHAFADFTPTQILNEHILSLQQNKLLTRSKSCGLWNLPTPGDKVPRAAAVAA